MWNKRFFVFLYMVKQFTFFSIFMTFFAVMSQDVSLPEGLRQHALTEYNSSLFNPAFSIDRNNPQSISLWSRWQWQSIDDNPTTLFINYTTKLSEDSVLGAGFFQHNTGIFLNTGGVVNYAYSFKFNPKVQLDFGINLFGFSRSLANDSLVIFPPPASSDGNDFIMQLAAGIFLKVDKFGIGFASENLFDYNLTTNERDSTPSDRIYMGMTSYDFQIGGNRNTILRPMIYAKSTPGNDTQIGGNALFSSEKFWAQTGYNSFYGVSVGGGGRFFKKISLGALMEFGTDSTFDGIGPTYEIYASYFIKSQFVEEIDEKVIPLEEEKAKEELTTETLNKTLEKQNKKEVKALAAQEKAIQKEKRKDSLAMAKKEKEALAIAKKQEAERDKISSKELENDREEQQRLDSTQKAKNIEAKKVELAAQKQKEKKRSDSINTIKAAQAEAIALKKEAEEFVKKADQELVAKQAEEKVEVQAGEKYQEVINEGGLESGFYLIANVFGTKKYFDAFMNDLRKKGIEPKSFYRSKNKYNYAYLERFNTIGEARRARDSKFNGKYQEKTWIFRVK